jgi:hypothetical protein
MANDVKEKVLAVEKAKIMGEITINVRNMVHVDVQQEVNHANF